MGRKNRKPIEYLIEWMGTNAAKFVAVGSLISMGYFTGTKFETNSKNLEIQDLKSEYDSKIMALEFQVETLKLKMQALRTKKTENEPREKE